ncbi:MAG: leucine-rich repeat protein [Bacilli bacterium]|nr:leucine-rich repeat protein [Bacilli bacterium]
MKKIFFLLILFSIVFAVVGCQNTTETRETEIKYILTLRKDGTTFSTISDLDHGQKVELPILEEEGMIFIGWSSETETFYREMIFDEITLLNAAFETASEVFEYSIDEENMTCVITGYSGEAKYLKIPEIIDEYHVIGIGSDAFRDSDLVEVFIPNSVSTIGSGAFQGTANLYRVAFYGDFYGIVRDRISEAQYDVIIEEFSEQCIIASGSIESGSWTFESGCPIMEVTEVQRITVLDMVKVSYVVIMDNEKYPVIPGPSIYENVFADSLLHRIEFSERLQYLEGTAFIDALNLTEVVFPLENDYYTVVDGVVYSKDMTKLHLYPAGLTANEYILPETIQYIAPYAFYYNEHLERIVLPESLLDLSTLTFGSLPNLTEYVVDEDNEYFVAIDGVLFSGNALISYPDGKRNISYTVPDDISQVMACAFQHNRYLESIFLPDSLISIGMFAFEYSEGLTLLDIPTSVQQLGRGFADNSSIESVLVRRSFIINGSITEIEPYIGEQMPYFYIPDNSWDNYMDDDSWLMLVDQLKPISEYTEN